MTTSDLGINIPTKVSDLTNDSGFITQETDPTVPIAVKNITSSDISNWNSKGTYSKPSSGIPKTDLEASVQTSLGLADTAMQGMTILSYGSSTWQDFIDAYTAKKVVYCRASSNSNPATGSQTRLAFMAYVDDATNPTNVEFQYYRSVSSHSDSQQGDQVFVYKITSAGTWTVTTRNAFSKVVAGTNMSSSYNSGTITLSATDTTYSAFTGTDGTTAGTAGLVPAPTTADTDKYLKSDGTWATVSGGGGNYVSKAGDTMTGALTTTGLTVGNRLSGSTDGANSTALGKDTTASGKYSVAEGKETIASGNNSHAEGDGTTASGTRSHAEGKDTEAFGMASHAQGIGTIASREGQHVEGEYNIADTGGSSASDPGDYLHITGNGFNAGGGIYVRSNAYTLDWSGNGWFAGNVYVGSTSGINKDAGSKKLISEASIATSITSSSTNSEVASAKAVYDSSLDVYSTTEQRVGTWIDGKPIYRTVIYVDTLPNNTTLSIAHNIANIETFVEVSGIGHYKISGGSSGQPIPYISAGGFLTVWFNDTYINVVSNSDRSSQCGYFYLSYTKTTDSAS